MIHTGINGATNNEDCLKTSTRELHHCRLLCTLHYQLYIPFSGESNLEILKSSEGKSFYNPQLFCCETMYQKYSIFNLLNAEKYSFLVPTLRRVSVEL
jgi:hypothetical protein